MSCVNIISFKNRNGQLKVSQKYLSNLPVYLNGRQKIPPPKVGEVIMVVVSIESLKFGVKSLKKIMSSVPVDSKFVFVFLQTVLIATADIGSMAFRKEIKRLLMENPRANNVILFNETKSIFDDPSIAQQKYWENEKLDSYYNRMIIETCKHLRKSFSVLVLCSSDEDCLYRQSAAAQFPCSTLEAFVNENCSEHLDFVRVELADNKTSSNRPERYVQHLSQEEIDKRVASGSIKIGTMVCYDHSSFEGEVVVEADGHSRVVIAIQSRANMNRALDGDMVAVEILPITSQASSLSLANRSLTEEFDVSEAEKSQEKAEIHRPSSSLTSNLFGNILVGKIVGIVNRNARDIVASVPLSDAPEDEADSDLTATITPGRERVVLLSPIARNIPFLRLRTRLLRKLQGKRVITRFDSWPCDSKFPNVHFIKVIGDPSDWRTDIDALLERHQISPRPFSANALKCLPQINDAAGLENDFSSWRQKFRVFEPWKDSMWELPLDSNVRVVGPSECLSHLDGNNTTQRLDIRSSRRVFSVDPVGCQDIDDTMCIQWIDSDKGLIEVSVIIADVCAFLQHGSALDIEAQSRGTTVYLPHVRFDMLPKLLSSDIASLHGNKDRFAVAVSWLCKVQHTDGSPVKQDEDPLELHAKDDIHFILPDGAASFMGRVAIRSIAAMTYIQAHNMIHGQPPDDFSDGHVVPLGQAGQPIEKALWPIITADLKVLTAFGRYLKKRRIDMGAVIFDQSTGTQLKFDISGNSGDVTGMQGSEHLEIHSTIEELMVLANSAVAATLTFAQPATALIRIHPPASVNHMQDSLVLLAALTEQSLNNEDVALALRDVRSFLSKRKLNISLKDRSDITGIIHMLTSVMIRSMNEAKYVCAGTLTGKLFGQSHGYNANGANSDPVLSGAEGTAESDWMTVLSQSMATSLFGHSGLGLLHYTHFTSPIRRYADVIVHRQLLQVIALQGKTEPWKLPSISSALATSSATTAKSEGTISVSVPKSQIASVHSLAQGNVTNAGETDNNNSSTTLEDAAFDIDLHGNKVGLGMAVDDLLDGIDSGSTSQLAALNDDIDALLMGVGDVSVNNSSVGTDLLDDIDGLLASTAATAPDSSTDAPFVPPMSAPVPPLSIDDDIDALLSSIESSSGNVEQSAEKDIGHDMLATPAEPSSSSTSSSSLALAASTLGPNWAAAPYSGVQVAAIADHLNTMNRRSKRVQSDCQALFLTLYFRNKIQSFNGVIYAIRNNGVVVYISEIDFKGSLFIRDRDGMICLDPSLVGEAAGNGVEAPSYFQGHSTRQGNESLVRGLPDYECFVESTIESASTNNTDGSKSEQLVIRKRGQVGEGQDGHTLRLSLLQNIRVDLSAPVRANEFRIQGIQLSLLSTATETDTTKSSKSSKSIKSSKDATPKPETSLNFNSENVRPGNVGNASDVNRPSKSVELTSFDLLSFHRRKTFCFTTAPVDISSEGSLVRRQQFDSSNVSHHAAHAAKLAEKLAKQKQRLAKESETKRHSIAGTGRLAFGNAEEVRPVYLVDAKQSHANNSSYSDGSSSGVSHVSLSSVSSAADSDSATELLVSKGTNVKQEHRKAAGNSIGATANNHPNVAAMQKDAKFADAQASLNVGINAAKAKMAAWGEVWAEEEDLPDSFGGGRGDGASTATATGNGDANDQLSSSMRRQVQLANSRIDKLKVAKRRSKYDG